MFRCYFCNQVTPPKTTRHSVIIEVREKRYSVRRRPSKKPRNFRDREDPVQDRGGTGIEITREVDACPKCAAQQHETKKVSLAETVPPEAHPEEQSQEQSQEQPQE